MIDYINNKTRIKLKFYIPAVDYVLALQRKKWYGWKTVRWTYPSTHKNENSCQYIYGFLVYKETYKREKEVNIGRRLMTMCEGKFIPKRDEKK